MFITALFTITQNWNYPKCTLEKDKQIVIYSYSETLLSKKIKEIINCQHIQHREKFQKH